MGLAELIAECIKAKQGDKEFMLHFEQTWQACIGNSSMNCPIGEMVAYGDKHVDFVAYGDTPEEAVSGLLAKING